ncbi:enhanced serine sensitivity protein SseB [Carnobacterium maltaromaticum]|jgi:hypothetical protein|uniref:Enhanced serine sensitivity protein SseB n=1 Tax=Carnobacterium maltaromaticum LMA28 TaxID=1234679 RepID=K8EQ74_CARML|nr:enhanced serine sensitivity protein SseB [Carnobacterium maltaromaticum]AOA01657.1 hypothetical protein BFC23_03755 [Carnobacterium maltaromaticum]KRN68554.1 hypothetical protein IV70_GL001134 [Carnobacterium maltaromaticum DSM 20342]MCI1817916.1 enhanced serine sensitivity protein SseB [Carnobacterium maltaromaticum]CCO10676.2 putative uncharacterized protein [Carnobacterium maltaromaticum LMA28]
MHKQNLIENNKLLEIVKSLKEKHSNQVETDFHKYMQKSNFLLPAIIKENNKISIVKIIDEKGIEYLPAFTDWKNFQLNVDNTKEVQSVIFSFKEFFNILESDLSLFGIVINPYSDNLVLSRENLNFSEEPQDDIRKGDQVSLGVPKDYPYLFVEKCIDFFKKDNSVRSAFLLQMVKKNQISLLLVIETENIEAVFSQLSKHIVKFLDDEKILDIIPLDTPLGRNITEQYAPFFECEK